MLLKDNTKLSWVVALRRIAGTLSPGRSPIDTRKNNLDFFRLTFACAVVFSHSFALLVGSDEAEPLYRATRGQVSTGALAVDAFFIISGFLITGSWFHSKGVADFSKRRIRRIYPGYLLAFLAGLCIIEPLTAPTTQNRWPPLHDAQWVVRALTTLRFYDHYHAFPSHAFRAVNGSLWTVGYEWWCYVGVVILGATGLLARRAFVSLAFVSSLLLGVSLLAGEWHLAPRAHYGLWYLLDEPLAWARLLPCFLAGAVFYLFRDVIPQSRVLLIAACALLIATAFVPHGLAISLPTAGTYVLLSAAFYPISGISGWANRVGGDYSYGVYLWACPIQQLIISAMGGHTSPMILFALSLPASICAGVASWHLCEKWFLRRSRVPATTSKLSETGLVPAAVAR